jgi:hypothetical protein
MTEEILATLAETLDVIEEFHAGDEEVEALIARIRTKLAGLVA